MAHTHQYRRPSKPNDVRIDVESIRRVYEQNEDFINERKPMDEDTFVRAVAHTQKYATERGYNRAYFGLSSYEAARRFLHSKVFMTGKEIAEENIISGLDSFGSRMFNDPRKTLFDDFAALGGDLSTLEWDKDEHAYTFRGSLGWYAIDKSNSPESMSIIPLFNNGGQ